MSDHSPDKQTIEVSIYDRGYRVACEPHEQDALRQAVKFVDTRMRELGKKSQTTTPERIAVMAALNITHEFLSFRASHAESFDMTAAKRRIEDMEARLDALLADSKDPQTKKQEGLFEAV